ncbi:MAG TPA: hypothetical protein VJ481_00375 [Patescibacteria group bacterium]|uniref:Glycosyltransferase RgtA/B/C/D-like domain-containing protein n=1 Tax=Candidatus Woesebacteria bacterium RBG_13_46_13 TaxID=1802479 RepID=A0A1F7X4U5_9BACT|nr:MAG: hypothetical protein A2Y68_00245 [Candidatus Woesebacteria bacterium RBG_13_46_13]HJX58998.1 hypothetical protein [Patescibacteria group bacterium]
MSKKAVNIKATFGRAMLLGIITLLYFGYSYFILRPQVFNRISLIDDITNQVETSEYLKKCIYKKECNDALSRVFDIGSRRLRPAWWVIGALTHTGLGENPTTEHLFRAYGIGFLSVITLALTCISMGMGGLFLVLASLIYFTNFSFTENIIRLGPNEPYSVFLLGIFSLLFLEKEKIISKYKIPKKIYYAGLLVILIITLFIKENTFVVIPAIFIYEAFRVRLRIRKMDWGLIIIPFMFWGMSMIWSYTGKNLTQDKISGYTSYYVLSLPIFIDNGKAIMNIISNSTMPFLKLIIPLILLNWVLLKHRKTSFDNRFWYWIAFLFFFTVVLFPWKYILDRYQLMAIWAIAIVSTYLLKILYENILAILKLKTTNPYSKYVIQAVVLLILSNLFFRGFPLNLARSINYSRFFESFLYFEKEQVEAIKSFNSKGVCINSGYMLDNSEIYLSIPKALRYLYNTTPNFYVLENNQDRCKYLFSRTAVIPLLSKNELSKMELIESFSYKIPQINPLFFRESFTMHPLKTIIDTNEYLGDSISLYWEIRKFK